MSTLKSVIEDIEAIVSTNVLYNTFGSGNLWEIDGKSIDYPCIWVNDESTPHFINESSVEIKLDVVFFDKVFDDESNELQIKSDTLESAIDFVRFLKDNYSKLDFYIKDTNAQVRTFTEKWNDNVSGSIVSLVITLKGAGSKCKNIFKL